MQDTSPNNETPRRQLPEWTTERLDSWKEIANFFRREVRTVQLWEKNEGLPVRRHHHKKLGSVYAYRRELEGWWASRSTGYAGIAPQVHPALAPVKLKPSTYLASHPRGEDPGPAYHAYMMGLHFWNQRTRIDLMKAVSYFQEALLLNPEYADAYAGLADTYVSLSYNHLMPPRQAMEAAKRAVQTGRALAPRSLSVLNAEINFRANCAWDWAAAERLCQHAVKTEFVDSRTFQLYASLMINLGRHDEAIRLSLHAHRLDPLSDIVNSQVSFAYFYAGDYDNALAFIDRTIELRPRFAMCHALLGRTQAERGNWEQAIEAFERGLELSAHSVLLKALVAYGHAGLGDSNKANELLREINSEAGDECFPAYDVSAVHVKLNQENEALENIFKAYEMHDMKMTYIQYDPRFNGLRSLPQLQKLTASIFPVGC